MSKLLTEQDFQIAAQKLRCEIPAIKAVAEIESRGKGFYADGFPVILFERHVFRKFTQGRYNKSHPHLSGPAGNYGTAGQNQRNKFNEAFALNPIAAMKACSWGKFQIMGFNHAVAGFATVGEFVDAMKQSEGEHLLAFVNFVINNNLADEIRNKNWAAFARGYNGAGYAKNKYDVKMAAAYRKYAAQKITSAASQTAETVTQTIETETGKIEKTVSEVKDAFEPKNLPAFIPRFGKKWFLALIPGGGAASSVVAKISNLPDWVIYGLLFFAGITTVLLIQFAIKHHEKVLEFIKICYEKCADPTQHNLIPTNVTGVSRQAEIERAVKN